MRFVQLRYELHLIHTYLYLLMGNVAVSGKAAIHMCHFMVINNGEKSTGLGIYLCLLEERPRR